LCDCFQVPQCNPEGELSLTKECSSSITNNQAALNYRLTVSNIGDAALDNVQFTDIISIPAVLQIGTITVTPASLIVDTGTSGLIRISGNLGTIEAGGQVVIHYAIQIVGVTRPGSYTVVNMAMATAVGTQSTATCSTTINAVQLSTDKFCTIEGDMAVYKVLVSNADLSPDVRVDIVDSLFIPGGVTVRFTSFSDCRAIFSNTEEHVPLDVDITGPRGIRILCNDVLVPADGTIHKDIRFLLVSSSIVGLTTIVNQVESVTPTIPENQVFLGAGTFPVTARINVELSIVCLKPCS